MRGKSDGRMTQLKHPWFPVFTLSILYKDDGDVKRMGEDTDTPPSKTTSLFTTELVLCYVASLLKKRE